MSRARLTVALIVVLAVASTAFILWQYSRARDTRRALFDELTPVTLANCEMARYGDADDGGYLLCRNLLSRAKSAYSYGIDGHDEWGCQVSRELSIPVHQYDCFNTTAPTCQASKAFFNATCVGPRSEVIDGRPFGTMSDHIVKNDDANQPLLMKMDVEGSEWASLLAAPDEVLREIDQLAIEFHGVERPEFVTVAQRLKRFLYVANVHVNNYSCSSGFAPFPGSVVEVLFVSKRLAEVLPAPRIRRDHPLDAPNAPRRRDCQGEATSLSEFASFRRWLRRFAREAVFGSPFAEP